jgi:hypothetical protein
MTHGLDLPGLGLGSMAGFLKSDNKTSLYVRQNSTSAE